MSTPMAVPLPASKSVTVPFLDLKTYHGELKTELQELWNDLISSCAFVAGPKVREFESAFAEFCGVRHAIGVANGTDALTLAMRATGIGEGDEVILPANSFVATAEAVCHAGALPVFADISEQTYNIDVLHIESLITGRTKAIIPVHLYGQPADMDPILEIAHRHHLNVIEDAAQAHGAGYRGRKTGSMGNAACFSFYPGKNLGACGDGGAVVTNDDKIALNVRLLQDHGGIKKYQHDLIGYNSRLDTLQAALLLRKLKDLPERNRMRQSNAEVYSALLSKVPGIAVPATLPGTQPIFHLYVIRVDRGKRDELQQFLAERGIQTGIHYPKSIPCTPAFSRFGSRECPIAAAVSSRILSLPMYPELTISQIEHVAHSISDYMDLHRF